MKEKSVTIPDFFSDIGRLRHEFRDNSKIIVQTVKERVEDEFKSLAGPPVIEPEPEPAPITETEPAINTEPEETNEA